MRTSLDRVETGLSLGLSFFETERFSLSHRRIYEDTDHVVYRNERADFAMISPRQRVDYQKYLPRSQKLGLKVKDPKVENRYLDARLTRFQLLLEQADGKAPGSLLEIGASDGTFLDRLRRALRRTSCLGVKPSGPHRTAARDRGLWVFESLEEAAQRSSTLSACFTLWVSVFRAHCSMGSSNRFSNPSGCSVLWHLKKAE